jgi:Tfp pilus assembly protein PilF
MQGELASYLRVQKFESLSLAVRSSLLTAQAMTTRPIGAAETCCCLGDELVRVGKTEQAEKLFLRGARIVPANPFPYEGLGLMASERGDHAHAVEQLKHAIDSGSKSFLTHYLCARELLAQTATAPDQYSRVEPGQAAEIQKELETSLALMPEFGPGHHLLGFFQLLQEQNLAAADLHLKRAIELEPENPSYLLTLAQVQMAERNPSAARSTLKQLCLPYVDGKLRAQAETLLSNMSPSDPPRP